MYSEPVSLIALFMTRGAGHAALRRALAAAAAMNTTVDALLEMSAAALSEALPVGAAATLPALLSDARKHRTHAQTLYDKATNAGAQLLVAGSGDYPASLRGALGEDAPVLLWVCGDLEVLDGPCGGIAGAREASERGLLLAEACAEAMVRSGHAVVSGGAAGVDTAAHRAALRAGGTTVVVLPQGLLTYPVPPYVGEALDEGRAVLVSSFVPDMPWETHAAVARNAIISALSSAVCIIEPAKQGGSIRTGQAGLAQGKAVLVYGAPSQMDGAAGLLALGAKPILNSAGQFDAQRIAKAMAVRRAAGPEQGQLF